jgi:hypothetical protein
VVLVTGTGSDHDGLHEVEAAIDNRTARLKGSFLSASNGGEIRNLSPGRRMSDLHIRGNTFSRGTEIVRLAGSDNDCSFALPATQRVTFAGNKATDHDIRSYAGGGRVDVTGAFAANGDFGARMLMLLNGELEYLDFSSNYMTGNKGGRPTLLVSTEKPGSTVYGLRFHDNVFSADTTQHAVRGESLIGVRALDALFPGHTSSGNVLCCAGAQDSFYSTPLFRLVKGLLMR